MAHGPPQAPHRGHTGQRGSSTPPGGRPTVPESSAHLLLLHVSPVWSQTPSCSPSTTVLPQVASGTPQDHSEGLSVLGPAVPPWRGLRAPAWPAPPSRGTDVPRGPPLQFWSDIKVRISWGCPTPVQVSLLDLWSALPRYPGLPSACSVARTEAPCPLAPCPLLGLWAPGLRPHQDRPGSHQVDRGTTAPMLAGHFTKCFP